MKNLKTKKISRNTNHSFIETTTLENGSSSNSKLEKGGVDYANACMLFHSNNVAIEIGNEITK